MGLRLNHLFDEDPQQTAEALRGQAPVEIIVRFSSCPFKCPQWRAGCKANTSHNNHSRLAPEQKAFPMQSNQNPLMIMAGVFPFLSALSRQSMKTREFPPPFLPNLESACPHGRHYSSPRGCCTCGYTVQIVTWQLVPIPPLWNKGARCYAYTLP